MLRVQVASLAPNGMLWVEIAPDIQRGAVGAGNIPGTQRDAEVAGGNPGTQWDAVGTGGVPGTQRDAVGAGGIPSTQRYADHPSGSLHIASCAHTQGMHSEPDFAGFLTEAHLCRTSWVDCLQRALHAEQPQGCTQGCSTDDACSRRQLHPAALQKLHCSSHPAAL